jgi:hypothetical protein
LSYLLNKNIKYISSAESIEFTKKLNKLNPCHHKHELTFDDFFTNNFDYKQSNNKNNHDENNRFKSSKSIITNANATTPTAGLTHLGLNSNPKNERPLSWSTLKSKNSNNNIKATTQPTQPTLINTYNSLLLSPPPPPPSNPNKMISPGQHSCSSDSTSSDTSSTSSPSSLTSSGTSSPVSPRNLRKNVRELINKVQEQQQQHSGTTPTTTTTKSSSFNTKMSNRLNKNSTLTNTTSFNHKNVLIDSGPRVDAKTTTTSSDSSNRPGTIFKLNNPFITKNFDTNITNTNNNATTSTRINRVYKSRNKSNECRSNSKNF